MAWHTFHTLLLETLRSRAESVPVNENEKRNIKGTPSQLLLLTVSSYTAQKLHPVTHKALKFPRDSESSHHLISEAMAIQHINEVVLSYVKKHEKIWAVPRTRNVC